MIGYGRGALMTSAAIVSIATAAPACAQQKTFDIPAQSATTAIAVLGGQADIQIVAARKFTRGKTTNAVRGAMTVDQALAMLLAGTGLIARQTGPQTYMVISAREHVAPEAAPGSASAERHASQSAGDADPTGSPADILVTGSRIKGAITASPTVRITAAQIKEEGQSDLGQVIRDIPQNFSGGQNPGVLSSAAGTNFNNSNSGGGSALNLRGLGTGATLTLLNGKRMAYSAGQNAIDVSAIPIAAVDRIEVVADGASAIYGSDAVAGVANVVLKRDYHGVTAALRGGTTTRGGGSEYQLSLTGGTTWQGGGFLLAYDRGHSNAIFARSRGYVIGLDDPTTLFPALSHDSFLLSGHQAIGAATTFSLDALYGIRTDGELSGLPPYVFQFGGKVHSFIISPALEVELSRGWTAKLTATYGRDTNSYFDTLFDPASGTALFRLDGSYLNQTRLAELGVEGPLIELPAGAVRVAAGAGYRRNTFLSASGSAYGGADSNSYAYGELNAPLVSPAMNVAAIYRLSLSVALRYEKYARLPGSATPKVGLVYEPTRDFSLKGSWGKSFKAATLTQQFQPGSSELASAGSFGGIGYAPSADAIIFTGPNPNLRPERADSWTATFAVHPEKIAGLNVEISYFNIDYTDRIVSPVNNSFAALSEPAYASFVTLSPTASQISAVLAASSQFSNDTGGNPMAAVAIIDNSLRNVSSDHVSGVDVSGSLRVSAGGGALTFRGSGSWLRGHREILKGSPVLKTSGVIFNPPGFHGRAGFTWVKSGFSATAFVNHLDGVFANYFVLKDGKTGSMDTVDLNMRYGLPEKHGPLAGVEFAFKVNNLFDAKPPLFQTSFAGLPNYDSTNYSSIGRALSFTVTKKW